ncbi:MAG: helix-turn-helix transcriptional regulator [Candidatus Margulisbacteria bacterium]|nr:helix-turn-helix transcriptional regulator [Candidatus Margulisiibacteriota bacterium]
MAFKDTFKKYRVRQKLTKVSVAKCIHKTDAYVRKIENQGYTPPKYDVCKKLSDIFDLTDEEKGGFLKEAFIERLKGDSEFYENIPP